MLDSKILTPFWRIEAILKVNLIILFCHHLAHEYILHMPTKLLLNRNILVNRLNQLFSKGFEPSQADNVIFDALGQAPPGDLFHAVRFFNHIGSFSEAERKAFPGTRKSADQYGSGATSSACPASSAPAAAAKKEDDDIDLFGSDEEEESEEKKRIREERLAAYAAKKTVKPGVIAKSCVKMDIKPWDDETNLAEMEKCVRSIEMDGLVWGQCNYFSLLCETWRKFY